MFQRRSVCVSDPSELDKHPLRRDMQHKKPTRIVVLGGKEVGKTALVHRCLTDKFKENYESTGKDEAYRYSAIIGRRTAVLDIVDSNGKSDAVISQADAFILCYSITDRKGFELLSKIVYGIQMINLREVQFAVIANKSDKFKKRVVSSAEGLALARGINAAFYETSAKIPVVDIKHIFFDLHRSVKDSRKSALKRLRGVWSSMSSAESSDDSLSRSSGFMDSGLLGHGRLNQSRRLSSTRNVASNKHWSIAIF